MAGRDWTAIDVALCAHYALDPRPARGVSRIARDHGLTPVQARARALTLRRQGRVPAVRQRARWSAAEDAYLRTAWGQAPLARVRARLAARSYDAIRHRARRLGLVRQEMSLAMIVEAVGCPPGAARGWRQRGWLHARLVGARTGQGRRFTVTDQALHDFLVTYPDAWQKYPCPGRLWLDGFIAARDLHRASDGPLRTAFAPPEPARLTPGPIPGTRAERVWITDGRTKG